MPAAGGVQAAVAQPPQAAADTVADCLASRLMLQRTCSGRSGLEQVAARSSAARQLLPSEGTL